MSKFQLIVLDIQPNRILRTEDSKERYNIPIPKRREYNMAKLFKKLNLPEKHLTILVFLLAGDLFYILLHLIHKGARHFDLFTTIRMGVFGVHNELSLGESYQYLKEYWIMLIFIWLIFRHKQYFYTGWAFLSCTFF
jgi:hypothetical protein